MPYGTRASNKDFDVLKLLKPTKSPSNPSPPARKRTSQPRNRAGTRTKAAKKTTKDKQDKENQGATDKATREANIAAIAQLEDERVRTVQAKLKSHPRRLDAAALAKLKENHQPTKSKPSTSLETSSENGPGSRFKSTEVVEGASKLKDAVPKPKNATKSVTFAEMNVDSDVEDSIATNKARSRKRSMQVEDETSQDDEPPAKRPRGKGKSQVTTANDDAVDRAPKTPEARGRQSRQTRTLSAQESSPWRVPSEDESEGDGDSDEYVPSKPPSPRELSPDEACEPNSDHLYMDLGDASQGGDRAWECTPLREHGELIRRTIPPGGFHHVEPVFNPELGKALDAKFLNEKKKLEEVEVEEVEVEEKAKGKGKGKGKEKEQKQNVWDEIKNHRLEKRELLNLVHSSPELPSSRSLVGLYANWENQVTTRPQAPAQSTRPNVPASTQQNASSRQTEPTQVKNGGPTKKPSTANTAEAGPSTSTTAIRTTLTSTTSIGPIRPKPFNRAAREATTKKPIAKNPRSAKATAPKEKKLSAPAIAQQSTAEAPLEIIDDDDEVAFATEFGGLGDEDDAPERLAAQEARATPSVKSEVFIKLEESSPIASKHRRRPRIKKEDDSNEATRPACRIVVSDLPSGAEDGFSTTFLPQVIKYYGARDEPWEPNSTETLPILQKLWYHTYRERVQHTITVNSMVFRSSDKKLQEWRSQLGLAGLAATVHEFTEKNLTTTAQCKQAATQLLEGSLFLYGPREGTAAIFWSPLVKQTYAYHLSMISPVPSHPQGLQSVDLDFQIGGVGLSAASVFRALKLWKAGHITLEAINRAQSQLIAEGKKASLTKNAHLSRAVLIATEASRRDIDFRKDGYDSTTTGLAMKAQLVFDTLEKMKEYDEECRQYRKPPRQVSVRTTKMNKFSKMGGAAADFLNLPDIH